jgi:hypothetical protein
LHLIPAGLVKLLKWLANVDASVIDQNVEVSKFLHDGLNHSLDLLRISDIDRQPLRTPTRGLGKLGGTGLRLFKLATGDDNIGPCLSQGARHGKTQAAIATRDKGNTAIKLKDIERHESFSPG